MVFSSLSFLYVFFPLCGLLYYLCKSRAWRNGVLLVFSLVFYAWGEPKNIVLLLLASLVAYVCGLGMEKWKENQCLRRILLLLAVLLLTGNLLVFKYLNFFGENLGLHLPQIALPIGISFYTFQILSYVIDLYRGKIQVQRNFFYLTLYVSFFPQLIAGPIVRYQTIENEIRNRQESLEDLSAGTRRFILGLAKKVILADNVGHIAEIIYGGSPEVYGTALYWLAAVAYALQIYFDFSGYSDMAIGAGRMFGFHFLENFNYPYVSLSITDFWRRWHISLSTWFRDYIYIPLGGNRVKRGRWVFNLLLVWLLTGFWHGAQWNFLLWGLYYGVLLLVEKLWLSPLLEKCPKPIRWLYAMVLVLLGWVLFNLTDFRQMVSALGMMFRFVPTNWGQVMSSDSSIVKGLIYIPLGILFSMPLAPLLRKRLPKKGWSGALTLALKNLLCLALAVLCIMFILGSTYHFFIYFRF